MPLRYSIPQAIGLVVMVAPLWVPVVFLFIPRRAAKVFAGLSLAADLLTAIYFAWSLAAEPRGGIGGGAVFVATLRVSIGPLAGYVLIHERPPADRPD